MIYANLIYFMAAIVIFSAAPLSQNTALPDAVDLAGIVLLLWLFWILNKSHFTNIKERFIKKTIDIEEAKRYFSIRSNIHFIIAVFLFAVEIFLFDLKTLLTRNPVIGSSEALTAISGLIVFMSHLVIIWHWAFRAMGDVLDIGESTRDYILSNVKFNLVIVMPWLLLSFLMELVSLIDTPWMNMLQNSGLIIILFLFLIAIVAPFLIIFLWDCKPLAQTELKESIRALCESRQVKFRDIMSWGALNKTLITAGVVGLIARCRYLLITPQLLKLLDKEEILAVVSHEMGHVKKRHLLFYLFFFIGYVVLGFVVFNRLVIFLVGSEFGLAAFVTRDGLDMGVINTYLVFLMFILFAVYFRFVFGYFMRIFERQADTYCFDTGIGPNPMISSFMKLGVSLKEDSNKPNWHHYNIAQRIDFLRQCSADPTRIKQHHRKVKRSLIVFFSVMLISGVLIVPFAGGPEWPSEQAYYNFLVKVFEKKIAHSPSDPLLHTTLGMLYGELEKWRPAKHAYETSLKLNYNQPEALNNLAWLLLKCPQKELLDHTRALKLARDAVRLGEAAAHIYDTLAESLLANGLYKEALAAAEKAAALAKENRQYYKDQLKKMKQLSPGAQSKKI
ncbi:MAG: M48 family metalloprotease [Candidatus Aminicenantes bacterium]|nr:M48 family metalloprotease [Candidatus Aminicenantes bacterium]